MIYVAEFGHVNRQHELHISCRQADVSSEEEEENSMRDVWLMLLCCFLVSFVGFIGISPASWPSYFVFFCFQGILSHEKPLLLIERAVGELRTYNINGTGGVLKQRQHDKHSPYLRDVLLYDNRAWTTDNGTNREGPRASTRQRRRVI